MKKWFKGMGLILAALGTVVTAPVWLIYVLPVMVWESYDNHRKAAVAQAEIDARMKDSRFE